MLIRISVCLILLPFLPLRSMSQTCTGSFGEPVVNLTFGTVANPVSGSFTNYTATSTTCPPDVSYTLTGITRGCFGGNWHTISQDHTPNDNNGNMMLVNASTAPGEF